MATGNTTTNITLSSAKKMVSGWTSGDDDCDTCWMCGNKADAVMGCLLSVLEGDGFGGCWSPEGVLKVWDEQEYECNCG